MSTEHPCVVQVLLKHERRSEGIKEFLGTGVIFAALNGVKVLTAWHVVEHARSGEDLWIRGGCFGVNPREVVGICKDEKRDAAVLALEGSLPSGVRPPCLAKDRRDPREPWADGLALYGYAGRDAGQDRYLTRGAVGEDGPTSTWKLAGARPRGFSGGPAILDDQVELIALMRHPDEGVTFLRHVADLRLLTHPLGDQSQAEGSTNYQREENLASVVEEIYAPLAQNVLLRRYLDQDPTSLRRRQLLNEGFQYFLRAATDPMEESENAALDRLVTPTADGTPFATRLQGRRGTGGSTVLAALNAILWLDAERFPSSPIPLFISLRAYEGADAQIDRLLTDVHRLKRALGQLEERPFILIVDGLDVISVDSTAVCLLSLFEATPERLAGVVASGTSGAFLSFARSIFAKALPLRIGVPHATFLLSDYVHEATEDGSRDPTRNRGLAEYEDLCLRALQVDRVLYDRDLPSDTPADEPVVMRMLEVLNDFRAPGVTSPLQKLLIDALEAGTLDADNLAGFLRNVCRTRYELDYGVTETKEAAFRHFHEEFGSGRQRTPVLPNREPSDNHERAYKALAGVASILRDYLVAYAIVDVLDQAGKSKQVAQSIQDLFESRRLDYDFPETVNHLCRRIVTVRGNHDSIRRTLIHAMHECGTYFENPAFFRAMNFATYLLARLCDPGDKLVIEALQSVVRVAQQQQREAGTQEDDDQTIQWMAARRTAEVSLIRVEAEGAGERYIHALLTNKLADQVNRGFHRLYYGDILPIGNPSHDYYDPVCIGPAGVSGAIFPDKGGEISHSWRSTQNALIKGVQQGLAKVADGDDPKWNFQLQLATLIAFVRSDKSMQRGISNRRLRDVLRSVLTYLHTGSLTVYGPLRAALDVLVRDLAEGGPRSPWRTVIDLYALKYETRSGWVRRGLEPIDPSNRTESVAEHVGFAAKLATLLLPPRGVDVPLAEEEQGYDRAEVIEVLLHHDDGEAFIGDWVVADDEDLRAKVAHSEMAAIGVIDVSTSLLRTHDIFGGVQRFERFERGDCINSRIARDLDCLENLIQLGVYWKWKRLSDEDFFLFRNNLISKIGDDRSGIRSQLKERASEFLKYLEKAPEAEMFWSSSFDANEKKSRFDQQLREIAPVEPPIPLG